MKPAFILSFLLLSIVTGQEVQAKICLRFEGTSLSALQKLADENCDSEILNLVRQDSEKSDSPVRKAYARLVKRLSTQVKTLKVYEDFFREIRGSLWSAADQRIVAQTLQHWQNTHGDLGDPQKLILKDLNEAAESEAAILKTENPLLSAIKALPGWEDLRVLRNARPLSEISDRQMHETAQWTLYSSGLSPLVFWGRLSELENLKLLQEHKKFWVQGSCRDPVNLPELQAVDTEGCVTRPSGLTGDPSSELAVNLEQNDKPRSWVKPALITGGILLGILAGFALKDMVLVISH